MTVFCWGRGPHIACACVKTVWWFTRLGKMASGYTEPPCDPPEVSRAFQQAEMGRDSTRKYECKL